MDESGLLRLRKQLLLRFLEFHWRRAKVMATSLNQTIEILSREKNIEPTVIISAIEDAVMSAARKQFKTGEELRARFNDETGEVDLFALMTVVEEVVNPATEISLAEVEEMGVEGAEVGDQLEFPKPTESLGRIAAQTAKQIIFQKVREEIGRAHV